MFKKAYVIGNNVSKSLSPHIFNYWFKQNNIDAEYLFKEVQNNCFDEEIKKIINDENVCGFNITIPFKESIFKYTNFVDKHAKQIGAINQVTKNGEKLMGKNTDWIGFTKSLVNIPNKTNKTAVVLGYGGASKAIIYALQNEGYKLIYIFNRSKEKLKKVINNKTIKKINIYDVPKIIDMCDLIINTTPIDPLKNLPLKKRKYNTHAFDLVYQPKETSFLSHFSKDKRIYGVSMLVYQAVPCFSEWFGVIPTIDKGLFDFLKKVSEK